MKISLNWLNEYVDTKDIDAKILADKITRAGVNVEAINQVNVKNLVIGKVLEKTPHSNSDHLNVCLVDLGTETVQIVCGASNVAANQKVIVAKVGAVLPGNFVIKKSVIRGVESNGMICSLSELGLEEKTRENGIHVLSDEAIIGEDPIKYYGLNDTVFELDLNPNRHDCLSHLGFAYEVGAVLNKEISLPDTTYNNEKKSINDYFALKINTDNVFMYQAKMVKDIVIKESPDFIKNRLISAGMRPINNVVDISNYIMLEYGQPLHFFDKDKLGEKIVVRMANTDEKTITLDKIERTLTNDDIVITNGNDIVAIAGVMGSLNSEVDFNTKDILIESAIFNPYNVRYTSIKLDLRSEASLRFEKGLSYEYTNLALKRACHLLQKYASGKVLADVASYDKIPKTKKVVEITKDNINKVLGIELSSNDILKAFNQLKFPVKVKKDIYTVEIPSRRLDISIKEDLIEEVGRLYGYDNIIAKMPVGAVKIGAYSPRAKFKKDISRRMRILGLNEVRTYTLISEQEDQLFRYNRHDEIKLKMPLSIDKSIIRQTIIPSLIKVVDYNAARNIKDINIYEISNTYYYSNEKYLEEEKLAFCLSGKYLNNNWYKVNIDVDFYLVKGIVENLLNYLGYANRYSFVINHNILDVHPGISAEIILDNEKIGYFGKIHPNISKYDLYIGEINLTTLLSKKVRSLKYKAINKYPSVSKDVAFIINKNIFVEDIIETIKKTAGEVLANIEIFDVYQNDVIGNDKKSIAFNLTFEDDKKTLTDNEVNLVFRKIIDDVVVKHQAILRDN